MKGTLVCVAMLAAAVVCFKVSRAGGHEHLHLPTSNPLLPSKADAGGIAIRFSIGITPPPGTLCLLPWTGKTGDGTRCEFPACNCFQSVNVLLGTDPESYTYRQWHARPYAHLELPSTWDDIESHIRVGDVVEFVAHTLTLGGTESATPVHAHLCAEPGGLMAGANNEARFDVLNDVPTNTHRWGLCTSREYYHALAARDFDASRPHSYTLVLYQKPGA